MCIRDSNTYACRNTYTYTNSNTYACRNIYTYTNYNTYTCRNIYTYTNPNTHNCKNIYTYSNSNTTYACRNIAFNIINIKSTLSKLVSKRLELKIWWWN